MAAFYTEEQLAQMPPEEADKIRRQQRYLMQMGMRARDINSTIPLGLPGQGTPTPAPTAQATPSPATGVEPAQEKGFFDTIKEKAEKWLFPGSTVFREGVDQMRKEKGQPPMEWNPSKALQKSAPASKPTPGPVATPPARRGTSPISYEEPREIPVATPETSFSGKVKNGAKKPPATKKPAGKPTPAPQASKPATGSPAPVADPTSSLPPDPFARAGMTAGNAKVLEVPPGGSKWDTQVVPETSSASQVRQEEEPSAGAPLAAGILQTEIQESRDPANIVDPRKVGEAHTGIAGAEATGMQELIRAYHRETDDQRKAAMWDKIVQGLGQIAGGAVTLASKPLTGTTYDATFKPTSMYDRETEQKVSGEKQKMGEDAWKRFSDRLLKGTEDTVGQARKNQEIPSGVLEATRQIPALAPGAKTTTTKTVGQGAPVPAYPHSSAMAINAAKPRTAAGQQGKVTADVLSNEDIIKGYNVFRSNPQIMAKYNRAFNQSGNKEDFIKTLGSSGFLEINTQAASDLYDFSFGNLSRAGKPTDHKSVVKNAAALLKEAMSPPPHNPTDPNFITWQKRARALIGLGIPVRIPYRTVIGSPDVSQQ